jgi:hypothetical protein
MKNTEIKMPFDNISTNTYFSWKMQLKLNAMWYEYLHLWTQPHSSLLNTETKTALNKISIDTKLSWKILKMNVMWKHGMDILSYRFLNTIT